MTILPTSQHSRRETLSLLRARGVAGRAPPSLCSTAKVCSRSLAGLLPKQHPPRPLCLCHFLDWHSTRVLYSLRLYLVCSLVRLGLSMLSYMGRLFSCSVRDVHDNSVQGVLAVRVPLRSSNGGSSGQLGSDGQTQQNDEVFACLNFC